MLTVFLYLAVFPIFASSQFLSYDAIRMRVPGRCMQGDYDCGLGQCVPISQFRDGKPDCMDGSDEWCFIGQVSCGSVYCADYKDALSCIVNPSCDGTSKQLPWCSVSKEKLCADKTSFPCKGYGECVLWEWLLDGKPDCIDGSDEDENYVMPLEHAYRCERNKTGLVLSKPIPPPPEDHPSLYVEGCSWCPNSVRPSTTPPGVPVDHTTPKNPFISSVSSGPTPGPQGSGFGFGRPGSIDNSQVPLNGFPVFSTPEPKPGEFFPSGVEISRITPPMPPLPNAPIGEFFPTQSSPPPIFPTTPPPFRIVTYPPISRPQFPQTPLVFPMRPDLAPITAPPPLNNWPIPLVTTTTPESQHHSSLPPITYPSSPNEQIPPIRPGIVITRPVVEPSRPEYPADYGPDPFDLIPVATTPMSVVHPHEYPNVHPPSPPPAGFRPVVRPVDENRVDTLIPLVPGLPSLPTRKPLTIPSFFTFTTPPAYFTTETIRITNNGAMPTLIPESEIAKYVQTKVPPSFITEPAPVDFVTFGHRITTASEGFIEEKTHPTTELPQTPQIPQETTPTSNLNSWGTTSRSKIIHVGPHGVVGGTEEGLGVETTGKSTSITEKPSEQETVVTESGENVIHIGSTVPTTNSSSSTNSTESTSTTSTSTTTTGQSTASLTGDFHIDSCLRQMSQNQNSSHNMVVCDCPNGQFKKDATSPCEETLSLMTVKIHVNSVCDTDRASFEEKQKILQKKLSSSYNSCIRPSTHGSAMVATIKCDECSVEKINRLLTTRSFGEPGSLNVTAEALGSELCSDSDFHHCHVYSDCVVDEGGLRYACRCKKGTTDTSEGYGRHCDGFPEESDCIMVLGICLIVWLLFLLGAFMLSLLLCLACYSLCRYRCCRQIAIHPANSEGLQTVVIGPKAAKSLESGNQENMPHMKAIFAQSLKHSAKGATSVGSAFALTDFKRKRISRAPEMSQVIEEVNEIPAVPVPEVESLPKISSLAKISTHTANSEPPTPVGVIETPILEKNSSSVSLVSANDNAPQLPSLPLPLPVPITTSTSTTNLEEKVEKEKEGDGHTPQEQQKVAEAERPASSHSIGVQPTIWETYRVLGQQYSKSDLTERKPSVDSLEQMFEARLAETARTTRTIPTVRTDKSDGSAIMFTAKPYKEDEETPILSADGVPIPVPVPMSAPTTTADVPETITSTVENQEQKENVTTKESEQASIDAKLADMVGTSSIHASRVATPSKSDPTQQVKEEEFIAFSPTLEKSLEAALLIEMAKRGIELPLSPKTPVPTEGELEKIVAELSGRIDDPEKPEMEEAPLQSEKRKSSAKSVTSGRKSKIPSASSSRSRVSSAKQREIDVQDNEPEVFVPQGTKAILEKKKILKRSGGHDLVPTTDESDPEIAFFKKLEKLKQESDRYAPVHHTRKYIRRRKPERTLSSISEKSAEIAADAALEYPVDTSISCPPTSRSFLEPRVPSVRRYIFKRKVIEASGETSDVDIPRLLPTKHAQAIVSSPEIPDVTFERSMENLHKSDVDSKPEVLVASKKSSLVKKKKTSKNSSAEPSSSVQSSRHESKMGSKATTPRNGEDQHASLTSRSTRHSVISRKIAIRKHELKAVSGSAHDLRMPRTNRSTGHSLRGAKSVEDISRRRPNWDISPHRDAPGPSAFLPPITPTRGIRTTANSPQPRHRRSDSHFSMNSLPLIAHSPTSFWSSPYFNPSEDSRKPPKEDLWWNPNKRV